MLSKATIKRRIDLKTKQLEELYEFYDVMLSSDVNSYTVGSRNLSRYKNISEVLAAIKQLENELDTLEAMLNGGGRRKAVAVIPRDW